MKRTKATSPKEDVISKSVRMNSGSPVLYQITPKTESIGTLTRITIGERDPRMPNKTILLVGETGSGKSTLINTLVNYVMGVKWEDDTWFEIIKEEKRSQAMSQTSDVTVYEIFGFEGETLPYSLTIIDTPGYGDTRGKKHDVAVRQRLFDLFRSKNGVHDMAVVGLVMKATDNRLTSRLSYIFDSVVSLFGKDIEKNIVALMTHSDGMPPMNAIGALLAAKMKSAKNEKNQPVHFLFNNCQREERNEDTETPLENAWRQTTKGMQRFTKFVENTSSVKLATTVEVLAAQIQLTACIHNLQERINSAEKKQLEIKDTQEQLKKNKNDLENDHNFTIDVQETYKTLEPYGGGWSFNLFTLAKFDGVTRCKQCEENCHYPTCTIAWDASLCEVMRDGCCTVCSGKCAVKHHIKDNQKFVTKFRTIKKTLKDIKDKYEKRVGDMSSLVNDLQKQNEQLEAEITQWLEQAFLLVLKLEEMALTFSTMSTQAYLDVLIKKTRERGDTEKLHTLEKMASQMDEDTKAVLTDVFSEI